MGSSYFYLEFLLAWLSLLKTSGSFRNPAIFALEYTLVPDASYPIQLHEAIAGYKHVVSITQDPSRICVSGDSAGATLILSLLLHLAHLPEQGPVWSSEMPDLTRKGRLNPETDTSLTPGMAVLISPWVTLRSPLDKNTTSDYLDIASLHSYASQYAGSKISIGDPLISPGNCRSVSAWRRASPSKGFFVIYGAEEVFAPETSRLVHLWQEGQVGVRSVEVESGIHAWPIAAMFVSNTSEGRLKGLRGIIRELCERMI
ncbi:uncharacterized protein BP5553_05546 [Venustampulla echinocandica]|uniref:Alpha/beta hydrolase fold-3 domain-containing protein n=1 Tax=Venustampulla echinocandica TaxID=2656787 RepID=A0A370TRI7_9HELO|nr:uncharacterized protein BP5553_05546 [Venustampulla echinocandica]RDL38113.1 hypothetical protein BP5553_05546 [Venustampulla echinocandica]